MSQGQVPNILEDEGFVQEGCGILGATRNWRPRGYDVGPRKRNRLKSPDDLIVTDVYSGLRIAYSAPDNTAESTTMAPRNLAGKRIMHMLIYLEMLANL